MINNGNINISLLKWPDVFAAITKVQTLTTPIQYAVY
jgi:hypothetical protein